MPTSTNKSTLLLGASVVLLGCASPRPVAVIQVEIVNGNPVTTARIGDEQIDVIVDTGGLGGIAISSDDLDRLDVMFTGETVVRTDALGSTFESRAYVVAEIIIGGKRFVNVGGFERTSSASGVAGGPPMNVLGRGLLHDYTVVVDYPDGEIRLYSRDHAGSICGAFAIDLIEMEDDILAAPIEADGGQMLVLMDTGATYSFVQREVVASRELETTDGIYRTGNFSIGGRDFGPLEMVVMPINGAPEIDALIGANFFTRHKACFDYGGRKVSILD